RDASMMIVESELRDQIERAANGARLAELYQWLMKRNWNVHQHVDSPIGQLAIDVEDILLAWSDGVQSESQAIQALVALLSPQYVEIRVRIDFEPVAAVQTFSTATSPRPLRIPEILIPLPGRA